MNLNRLKTNSMPSVNTSDMTVKAGQHANSNSTNAGQTYKPNCQHSTEVGAVSSTRGAASITARKCHRFAHHNVNNSDLRDPLFIPYSRRHFLQQPYTHVHAHSLSVTIVHSRANRFGNRIRGDHRDKAHTSQQH